MNRLDQDYYWYWFVNIPNVGNRSKVELMERFHHPSLLYECKNCDLEDILTEKQIRDFELSRDYRKVEESMRKLGETGARFISWESLEYPESFRHLYDPPFGLYLKGQLPSGDIPAVAIVGSRRSTQYGRKMAAEYASAMAEEGIAVISGMAAGIDAQAHRACLDHEGTTLGILGGGIDSMYPKSNWNLYLDMYQKGGILSEYNVGVPNLPGLFPMRNRLISGIADAVLVIEAGDKSGSLITADQGMEQGKDVYALPGRITDPMSSGCNHLIAQGAFLAESPQRFLKDFLCNQKKEMPKIREAELPEEIPSMDSIEYRILQQLDESVPVSFDELLYKTNLSRQELQHYLTGMELNSRIKQVQQNLYLKKFF